VQFEARHEKDIVYFVTDLPGKTTPYVLSSQQASGESIKLVEDNNSEACQFAIEPM
jgi:hypothetical protein